MFKKFKRKIDLEYNEHKISMNHGDFDDIYDNWLVMALLILFPSYAVGFMTGLVQKKKYDFYELIQFGFILGGFKTMIYLYAIMIIHTIVSLNNPVSLNSINDFITYYKNFVLLFASDNLITNGLTFPLSYLLGRDAKKGISTIKKKINDSKEKKELFLEQKKELEKELAKEYIVSPEVMKYTKCNRRKEIEDYKKLREEYVPTIEVVPESQKVMELK